MTTKQNNYLTGLTSWLDGLVSVFDVWGVSSNHQTRSAIQTDADAIASDWKAVGQDLWYAMQQYDATNSSTRHTS
jgi:hypothetical protein